MKITKTIPKTIPEVVLVLVKSLSRKEKAWLKSPKNHVGSLHHTIGMALRNKWKLWYATTPLVKDFKKRYGLFGHADDISGLIFECIQKEVYCEPWHDMEIADRFRKHWNKYGVDPLTGKEK